MNGTIDAATLKSMFYTGTKYLQDKKDLINELNVFPVPDGDTGKNMTMTLEGGVSKTKGQPISAGDMMQDFSRGTLLSARGNSGVILSQLLRGFSRTIAEADTLDVEIVAESFEKAVETAYKAVMKPKEGTILTVARGAADKALEMVEVTNNLNYFIDEVIKEAEIVLAKTPDMLPVLKQAGVVDSGGQGLVCVLQGGYDYLLGKDVKLTIGDDPDKKDEKPEIKYDYSAECVIKLMTSFSNKKEQEFKGFLNELGDSIKFEWNKDIIKAHVHTNDPGVVLTKALEYGALSSIKISNMHLEHEEDIVKDASKKAATQVAEKTNSEVKEIKEEKKEPLKEMGFVSVSIGEGMNKIFTELGCDYIIEGGQTMNPSTDDMLSAIEKVNAKNVFVLPNNKNIILAANQAASLCDDKNVIVLPTKTVPQGITAIINFIPDQSVDENLSRMEEEIKNVKTGQVTYAVRDTVIDDKEISEGDYMGIGDSGILAVDKDMNKVFIDMIKEMVDDSTAIITIYYGDEVDEKDAILLGKQVEEDFDSLEVEVQAGGQPVYYYVASVE